MLNYKDQNEQIKIEESIVKKENTISMIFPSNEEEAMMNLELTISSFCENFNIGNHEGTRCDLYQMKCILSNRNEKFFNLLIRTDILNFISAKLNSNLPEELLYYVLDLMELVLFSRNTSITQILYENGGLIALNEFLNENFDQEIVKKVLICIGYATFDIFKLNYKPLFEISSDQINRILSKYPDLYIFVLNFLSNSLKCINRYDLAVKTLTYYIFIIDINRCSRLNFSVLFNFLVERIKLANKEHNNENYPFKLFSETPLTQILCQIIWTRPLKDELISRIEEDFIYWALKLIIIYLKNDEEDLFLNKIIIQPNDYYELIMDSSSTENSVREAFHLLTYMLSTDRAIYFIKSLNDSCFLKQGMADLFNYKVHFNFQPFKVKIWYLRFLSMVISKSPTFDIISRFYTRDFIENVVFLLDPENISMSKSVLLTIDAVLDRAIKENHLFVVDFLMPKENPFDALIDQFCDEVENKEIEDLSLHVIQTFSQAILAKKQRE